MTKAITYNHGVPWEDGFGVTQAYCVNGTIYISGQFSHDMQGAFVGATPSQAYQVVCDESTTTPEDMDNGIVNILILFAPVKPAEFVVISLQQMAGQSSS